jgi:acyl dehydratase
MSVSDVSGKAITNLATEELKHPAPVFHGDTLFCEPEVLAKIRDCGALLTASTSREQAADARPTLDQTGIGLLRRESAIIARG